MAFVIEKSLGKISTKKTGYAREVNIVKWYDKEPKLDIREWPTDHLKAGKGLTLSDEESVELEKLLHIYNSKR